MFLRCHNHRCFYRDTISREAVYQDLRVPLPMRQTIPRRTPTRNFMVSGGANGYYTLLKGDPEVVVAKGNLIIPRRNSTTGRSFMSYPGQLCRTQDKYYYYYYYYYLNVFTLIDYITINHRATISSLGWLKVTFFVLQRYKQNRNGEERVKARELFLTHVLYCSRLFFVLLEVMGTLEFSQ